MNFFSIKNKVYPIIAVVSGIFILVFGLVTANTVRCSFFLLGAFFWLCVFGYYKAALHILPMFVIIGGIFFGIFYAVTGEYLAALSMANRFGAVFLSVVPGVGTTPVSMTRSLSQVHTPRGITLGMLISMSFMPMLKNEITRVREAMKTRGAGSLFSPKVFYRAFLVPLVMRLVNISDTLALSVETRGFALGKVKYTIYKREKITLLDIIYAVGLIAGAVIAAVI